MSSQPSKIAMVFTVLAAVAVMAPNASADNYGVWTSANISFSEANLLFQTPGGLAANGYDEDQDIFDPPTEVASVSGFGAPANPGYFYSIDEGYSGGITTFFLPDSLQFTGAATLAAVSGGNELADGIQGSIYAAVNFHLDNPTPYSLDGISDAPVIPAGYEPVLTGPANQTINLNGPMNGVLAAGDWQLLIDFQAIYLSDISTFSNYNLNGRDVQFTLTVPEPAVAFLSSLIGFLIALRRPARNSHCA